MTNNNVLVKHFGVIVPRYDIAAMAITVNAESTTSLVREFSPTGIFYTEEQSLITMLRLYVEGNTIAILRSLGVEIHETSVSAAAESEEEEASGEELDRVLYYVEYPLSSTKLPSSRHAILHHARYQALSESPKNAGILAKKVTTFMEACAAMGGVAQLEPETLDEEDETNGGLTLSDQSRNAQFAAHRANLDSHQEQARSVLDWFEQKITDRGHVVETMTLAQAMERYNSDDMKVDGASIFDMESLLADLNDEVVEL